VPGVGNETELREAWRRRLIIAGDVTLTQKDGTKIDRIYFRPCERTALSTFVCQDFARKVAVAG